MIDKRAIVEPGAKIAEDAKIGPWTYIGPNVTIGSGTQVGPNVVITGHTTIGKNNKIFPFTSLGEPPQDVTYEGEDTLLDIGDENIIREYCSINRGTVQGLGTTRIGNQNFIMAYVHIAHDCQIGNETTFVNNAAMGGHVKVDDYARVGGFVGVHQRCHIGAYSLTTAAMVGKDIPPFVIVTGNTASVCGINTVGLKRRGFSSETIAWIRRAYNVLYQKGLNVTQALKELEPMVKECPTIQLFIDAINNSTRGILR